MLTDAALMGKMDLGPAPKTKPDADAKGAPVSTGGTEAHTNGVSSDAP